MDILAALHLFALARAPAGFPLPRFAGIPSALLWPIVATAAVAMTGQLGACDCAEDLDRAFVGFLGLLRTGDIDSGEWAEASLGVLGTFMAAGAARNGFLATVAASN